MGRSWPRSWMAVMGILSAIMLLSFIWHLRVLPAGERAARAPAARTFADAFATFFRKKSVWMMIALAYFYRFGEGLIEKIGPLFLLDARSAGGLGLDNVRLGRINGTYGTVAFIVGALVGGIFAARRGLRRSLLLLVLAVNVPHVTYLYLSQARPDSPGAGTHVESRSAWGGNAAGSSRPSFWRRWRWRGARARRRRRASPTSATEVFTDLPLASTSAADRVIEIRELDKKPFAIRPPG